MTRLYPPSNFQTILLASPGRVEVLSSALEFGALDFPSFGVRVVASPNQRLLAAATGKVPFPFHQ